MALNKQTDLRVVSQRAEAERLRGHNMRRYYLVVFLLVLVSCKDLLQKKDLRLNVINTSEKDIFLKWSLKFPDTSLYSARANCSFWEGDFYRSKTTKPIASGLAWEVRFAENPYGRIIFSFFDLDSADYYIKLYGNCDSLYKREDLILKKYNVTIDSIIKYNWVLTYP